MLLLHSAGAALLLFVLWLTTTSLRKRDESVWRVIGLGFVARAVVAQVLFWISYAGLSTGPLLQHTDGVWSFAQDAAFYVRVAGGADVEGELASPVYVGLLGIILAGTGNGILAGVILNLLAYVATAHALVSIAGDRSARELRVASAVLAFSPAFFLWSLQPLKDGLMAFLLVAFVAACETWRRLLHEPFGTRRTRRIIGAGTFLVVATAMLAGIRFYVAAVLVAVVMAVTLANAMASRRRVIAAVAVVAAPFILGGLLVLFAGLGPFLPGALGRMAEGRIVRISWGETLDAVPGTFRATRDVLLVAPAASTMLVPRTGEVAGSRPEFVIPTAARDVFTAGAAVWLLPIEVAEFAGWAHIDGAPSVRLLMLVDTPVFTAVLLWALTSAVVALRRGTASPAMWIPLVSALVLALSLAYVIPNAGTVVRHRTMVLVLLVTVPVLARRAVEERATGRAIT